MGYLPELEMTTLETDAQAVNLTVSRAQDDDLPQLLEIARTAFQNERFKIDSRLNRSISDQRYQNWVSSCLRHPVQELYAIFDGDKPIAFFVTELMDDGTCYWHLNAITPSLQGQGYGRRVWMAMLNHAKKNGASRVQTSIVARNHRVLNLYARLGFYFPPPSMTFHWVKK
jgi:RimJ/RimL family protein N-acetyltransferase